MKNYGKWAVIHAEGGRRDEKGERLPCRRSLRGREATKPGGSLPLCPRPARRPKRWREPPPLFIALAAVFLFTASN
jgi:hypothetical protein